MIATKLGKDAPDIETIKGEVNAAKKALVGGGNIDWSKGIESTSGQQAAIAQTVLKQNGLDPTVVQGDAKSSGVYQSPKDLANAIAATDQPVLFNVGGAGTGGEQHSVTAQSDGSGGFLVNNLNRDGQTVQVPSQQMEGGLLRSSRYTDPRDTGGGLTSYSHVKYDQPIIFGGKP